MQRDSEFESMRGAALFAWVAVLVLVVFDGAPAALAQDGADADLRAKAVRSLSGDLVVRAEVTPTWIDGHRLWYRVRTGRDAFEFVYADAELGVRRPAFDAARLAQELSAESGRALRAENLPLEQLAFDGAGALVGFRALGAAFHVDADGRVRRRAPEDGGRGDSSGEPLPLLPVSAAPGKSASRGGETQLVFENPTTAEVRLSWIDFEGQRRPYGTIPAGARHRQHTFDGHAWVLARGGQELGVVVAPEKGGFVRVPEGAVPPPPPKPRGVASPDGRRRATPARDGVEIVEVATGATRLLRETDGGEGAYRGPLRWAPDGRTLVGFRETEGEGREITLVESSPKDQLQPKLHTLRYDKPGDRLAVRRPLLLDVESGRSIPITPAEAFADAWSVSEPHFERDGRRATFLYNRRGHQRLQLVSVDLGSGVATPLVSEDSKTFVDYPHKTWLHRIEDQDEFLWMSERDGWNHLYLIDANRGAVKQRVTSGRWNVREVEHVDAARRLVWFWTMGLREGEDPYHRHLCRVSFDGSGFVCLTEGDGTHRVEWSPDRSCFVARWSRVDQPPVTELRSADGRLILELERGDASALEAAGWSLPERFVAPGRDGTTPIHGIIVRPARIAAGRRLPVVERVYAGPQDCYVPKAWSLLPEHHEMAELGFVVVQADGMGTNWRGKAFHDVCWKNLADAGFPDRIAWLRAAAARYPEIDVERVGIVGGSAGGQNALRALIAHADVYDVAVADCGCHDNRMDKVWWNELWMGWPVGPHYEEQSNVTQAHRLAGKLLLVVGELDKNVDPASTMQVVNALVRADKDFDLLVIPGAGHGAAGTPYGHRRVLDFLVRHLQGRERRKS